MNKQEELFDTIYLREITVNIVDKYGLIICEMTGNVTDIDGDNIVLDQSNLIRIDWGLVNNVEKEIIYDETDVIEYTISTLDYSYVINIM